jgi:hypothetical protein
MLAPARGMERFFANHAGKCAAMRQLTENFLRGATGESSLQQAGGKIRIRRCPQGCGIIHPREIEDRTNGCFGWLAPATESCSWEILNGTFLDLFFRAL